MVDVKVEKEEEVAESPAASSSSGAEVLTLPDGQQLKLTERLQRLPLQILEEIVQLRDSQRAAQLQMTERDSILKPLAMLPVLVGGSARFPHFRECFLSDFCRKQTDLGVKSGV